MSAGEGRPEPLSTADPPPSPSRIKLAALAAFGMVLFAGFVALGTWQVHRLGWKLDLIARVDARVHADPVIPPGPANWAAVSAERHEYLHVRVSGHYLRAGQTLVRATTRLGRGYWVMTPLRTRRGFTVLINRGFVASEVGRPATPVPAPTGGVTVTGLLRMSEPGGDFLRPNDPEQDHWYSRDVAAIAASAGLPAEQVAPYFIDADAAAEPGKRPVGGLTVVDFRNAHLIYAITWYFLAALVVIAAVIVARFERGTWDNRDPRGARTRRTANRSPG